MIHNKVAEERDSLPDMLKAAEWSLEMQKALARYILNGKGINEVMSELSRKTKCCAVLEDPSFSVLSAAGEKDPVEYGLLKPYFSIQTGRLANANSPNLKNSLKAPVLVSEQYPGLVVNRLAVAVSAGTQLLGFLSLISRTEHFSEPEAMILEYAACSVAVLLAFGRKNAEMELRLKGDFIDDLISENYLDMESIRIRARALEYDIESSHRVLIAQFDESKQFFHLNIQEQTAFKNELVKRTHILAAQREREKNKNMVAYKNSEMILLVRDDKTKNAFEHVKQLCEEIIKETAPMLKSRMYIGIGRVCSKPEEYKQSYLSAKKALEIGSFMITEGQVYALEQFKMHTLFLSTLKPDDLYAFANEQLRSLIEYDQKHQSELIKTLQEFLYLRNHIEETARSLNMSVSGLKYRLKKIETIIGYDLKDHKICFDLQLALIVLQMFGEYKLENTR